MAEGKRYNLGFETDPTKLAEQTVFEQTKLNVNGQPLATTRSTSPRGDPSRLTIYNVSEILQEIPAYGSPAEALGRYEEVMNADMALSLKDGAKGDGSVLGDYVRGELLPPDMHARIGALQLAEGIYKQETGGSTGATTGTESTGATGGSGVTTAGQVAFSDLETHPNIGRIVDSFAKDAREGVISPNLLWILKFLADNLQPHNIKLWIGVGKTGHNRLTRSGKVSNHWHGRAADVSVKGIPFTNMTGHPGVQIVYDLLSSLHGAGPRQPYTTGGPQPQPARVKGGTLWFHDGDHLDHFHIDVSTFEPPANPTPVTTPATGGGTTPSVPARGSSTIGPPINVGAVTTRLANQKAVVNTTAEQQDLQRRCLTVVQGIINADPTILPEWRNHFWVAMIESGWAESGWVNVSHGDASSVGIFQLLSMHGTFEERMTPEFSARWWGNNARGVPAKNGKGTAGDIAWQTERPAKQYRYKYDTYRNQAVTDLAKLGIDARNVDP